MNSTSCVKLVVLIFITVFASTAYGWEKFTTVANSHAYLLENSQSKTAVVNGDTLEKFDKYVADSIEQRENKLKELEQRAVKMVLNYVHHEIDSDTMYLNMKEVRKEYFQLLTVNGEISPRRNLPVLYGLFGTVFGRFSDWADQYLRCKIFCSGDYMCGNEDANYLYIKESRRTDMYFRSVCKTQMKKWRKTDSRFRSQCESLLEEFVSRK